MAVVPESRGSLNRPLAVRPVYPPPGHRAFTPAALIPYIAIARPDHWFKNVFMLVGVLLAEFHHPQPLRPGMIAALLWAVATTCMIASSNYVLNEILDAPTDRSHPTKRHRPIPSGRVNRAAAYAEWLALGAVGLVMASVLNWPFFYSALFLLAMGVVYNVPPVRSKELPYLDVLSESINNPARLLLGWFAISAIDFPPVSLLISYWMIGAFLMATKRLAEYRSLSDKAVASAYRRSFIYYNDDNLIISMFFYITCFSMFLGIFIVRYHIELIMAVPLVAGFTSYYLRVGLKQDSAAQSPERLYREWGLMAYLALCAVVFFFLMFLRIPILYDWFNIEPSTVPSLWKV